MADEDETKMNIQMPISEHQPVRDLADFHLRWRSFRTRALSARDNKALSAEERETLDWLIRMADRIGRGDLG